MNAPAHSYVTVYVCQRCRAQSQRDSSVCGACGRVNSLRPVERLARAVTLPPPRPRSENLSAVLRKGEHGENHRLTGEGEGGPTSPPPPPRPVSLSSARAELAVRVPSGVDALDFVAGDEDTDGLPLKRVVVLGGERGTGKSSLLIKAAAGLCERLERPGLYVSSEGQDAGELRAMADAQGVELERLQVLETTDLRDVVANALELEPCVIVADSVSMLHVDGMRAESAEEAKYVLGVLRDLAREPQGCAVLAIVHMTKEGKARGSNYLFHLADTLLDLTHDEHAEGRIVVACDGKNRGGPSNRRAFVRFGSRGRLLDDGRA